MTAPIRWKEPNSKASPELRDVMRYAYACKPDAVQLAQLTAAVIAELPQAPAVGKMATTSITGKLATWGLVVALGGVGAVATTYLAGHAAQPPQRQARAPVSQASPPMVIDEPPPKAAAAPSANNLSEHTREQRHRAKKNLVSTVITQPRSEIELLQLARSARAAAPERALLLLSEHEHRYPESTFTEEREALRIEILQHTHREEAERRLRDFDRRFPHSAYRQRIGDPTNRHAD
jgi:hypothetical protein